MKDFSNENLKHIIDVRLADAMVDCKRHKLLPVMVLAIQIVDEVPAIVAFSDYSQADIVLRLEEYLETARNNAHTLIVKNRKC